MESNSPPFTRVVSQESTVGLLVERQDSNVITEKNPNFDESQANACGEASEAPLSQNTTIANQGAYMEENASPPAYSDVTNGERPPLSENNSTSKGADEPDSGMLSFYFGAGSFHPTYLQPFASTKFFTFMLCVFGVIEGAIISGFEPVVVSSLERRYSFSSTAASVIIIVFDISVTVSVIVISYFGEKAHKPRWIGIAFITQGIGALVFSLPHFIFGKYEVGSIVGNTSSFEACNEPIPFSEECDPGNTGAYILFLIGNIIIGLGAAPLFTVGVSFIDDIVRPKWVSLHIGAFQVATIAGPAIGFGLGSAFLNLYVDVGEPTNLTDTDPSWVGAWWVSFLLAGIVSIICAIPFFFFPRKLPDTHLVTEARQKQMKGAYKRRFGEEETFLKQLQAFPFHLLGLFKSIPWLFMTIAISVLFLSLDGLVSFAPKYIESVYRVSPSTAGLIIGAMGIVAGAVGTLTGAGVAHCVKIGKNMGIVNWVTVLASVVPLLGFFLVCPNIDVAGISTGTPYANNTIMVPEELTASCNVDCDCLSTIFEPVCGADGQNYFSPCRASCSKFGNASHPIFENCLCVADNLYNSMLSNEGPVEDFASILANSTATSGLCPSSCPFLVPFIVVVTIFVFLVFLIRVPFLLVTIRSVADEQRSLALGVQSVLFRVFGSIPGPLLFGVIIDSGCVRAEYECGRLANCWVYDNNLLSTRAYVFCTIGVAACVICTLISWFFYPPVGCRLAPPDEEGSTKKEPTQELENGVDGSVAVVNLAFNDERNN